MGRGSNIESARSDDELESSAAHTRCEGSSELDISVRLRTDIAHSALQDVGKADCIPDIHILLCPAVFIFCLSAFANLDLNNGNRC